MQIIQNGLSRSHCSSSDFLKTLIYRKALPGGRHAIEGDMMYANVDDVETKIIWELQNQNLIKLYRYTVYGEGSREYGLFVTMAE